MAMSRPRTALPIALGGLIVVAVAGLLWRSGKLGGGKPPTDTPSSVSRTVIRFVDCMLPPSGAANLRERVLLAPRSRKVLKDCQGILEEARRQLSTAAADKELEAALRQLEAVPFEHSAGELTAKADLDALDKSLLVARRAACRGKPAPAGCAPRQKAALPPALPVFDVALPEPAQGKIEFAAHSSRDGAATLAMVTLGSAGSARVWVAHSLDGGANWNTDHHDLPPAIGTKEVVLRVVEQDWLVVLREHDGGETVDALSLERTNLEPAGRLSITKGQRFFRVGAIAARVEAANETWAVVAVRPASDKQPLQLKYLRAGEKAETRPPAKIGRAVGLLSAKPPRLLLEDVAPTGFYRLWQVTIPPPDAPWPEPTFTTVAYVDTLTLDDAAAPRCGLPKEPFDIVTGRGPKKDAFFALSERAMYPFKFEPKPDSSVRPVCGSCPPGLLERTKQGLRVFLPIRRSLSGMTIDLAAGYSDDITQPVGVGCTATKLFLAYQVGEDLVIQPTKDDSWRYAAATIVARKTSVADVAVLGMPNRSIITWRTPSKTHLKVFAIQR